MTTRKALALLLSTLMLTLGVPVLSVAQGKASTTSKLRGQIVDAGGLGVSNMPVELVSNGFVVSTTTSTTDGHFSFSEIPAGSYIVRTMVNGQPVGVRVTVVPGESPTALLVLPSLAKAAPAAVILSVGLSTLSSAVAVVVTVVGSQVFVQAQEQADVQFVVQNQAAIQAFIENLNSQLPPNAPGLPPNPVFSFIPSVPASNPL